MMQLEATIAAPQAAPTRIISLISSLGSASVKAPRELSAELQARLEGIAVSHGGEVNLHGRLFAQWMHHAFPSECPYPHEAGTTNPLSPEGWMDEETEASEEERKQHIDADTCGPEQAAAEWNGELPWSDTEELLSEVAELRVQTKTTRQVESSCRGQVAFGILSLVVLVGVVAAPRAALRQKVQKWAAIAKCNPRLVLVSAIIAVAFATNMVNRFLIIFMFVGGLAIKSISGSPCVPAKALEKEKCMV